MVKLVSIIVPVYNAEKQLSKCLDSLCSQTYTEIELLLINDGSKDGSRKIMEHYAQRFPFVRIIDQENKGVSAARNNGIQSARGDYILFVDADDSVSSEFASKLIDALEKDGCGLSVCGYRWIDEKSGVATVSRFAVTGIQSRDVLIDQILRFRDVNSSLWNKAFIADVIRSNGILFSEELAIGEDLCFIVDYALHIEQVNIMTEPLYDYLINPEGVMSGQSRQFQEKWVTEWHAVCQVEKKLEDAHVDAPNIRIKKLRIANKLLSKCTETGHNDPNLRKELSLCLRKGLMTALRSDDFSPKKKMSIVLNVFFPGLRGIRNVGKKD